MEMERPSKRTKTSGGSSYDVFLSFCGADTRLNFTDHLYWRLKNAGVITFRDNEELPPGGKIGAELLSAIEHSKIFIPIFSKNYASSKWCLAELTHMVIKCKDSGQAIFPIFYDVTPSEVRNQKGDFGKALNQHTEDSRFPHWKSALEQVPDLKGFEREKIGDGHEGELVDRVLSEVLLKLEMNNVYVPKAETDALVGMERRVGILREFLAEDCTEVQKIGIYGMGGIGKTTVAKYIYNEFCESFEQRCCFVENVRETETQQGGFKCIDDKLSKVITRSKEPGKLTRDSFMYMKVLIVLDDVHEESKLKDFFGKQSDFLLGPGSKIIFTSRSKDLLLEGYGVRDSEIYELGVMNPDDSLHLFYNHAFRSQDPNKAYEDLYKDVVSSCHGLPLSLVVVGSYLCNKEIDIWKETSNKLKTVPEDKVLDTLKISYDALNDGEKNIFLDIACHFIGPGLYQKTNAFHMWNAKSWCPIRTIDRLVSLSLMKCEDNAITMHDLLVQLGRKIVQEESKDDNGKCSRIWSYEDAIDVLTKKQGTRRVQTLSVGYLRQGINGCSDKMFKKLSNLRYLQLGKSTLVGDFKDLLPNLRWLSWCCLASQIPLVNFCLDKLVILDLRCSEISDGWEDWMQIKQATKLKVLNMSWCSTIKKTPDFSTFKELELLDFSFCRNLQLIHPSVKFLKRLTEFKLFDAAALKELPLEFWELESLVLLDLSFTGIVEVSEAIQNLKRLRTLKLSNTTIKALPESIGNLKDMRLLNISGCHELEMLPNTIGSLEHLEELDATDCKSLDGEIPRLSSLRKLKLSGTKISGLPANMRELSICHLGNCHDLQLPLELDFPSSLGELAGIPFTMTMLDRVLSLTNLTSLEFSSHRDDDVGVNEEPRDMSKLSKLRNLTVAGLHNIVSLPMRINTLYKLHTFSLGNCKSLQYCPNLKMLRELSIYECPEMTEIGDLSYLKSLEMLTIDRLTKLHGMNGLGGLTSLQTLHLKKCPFLERLPDLSNLNDLRELDIGECEKLCELDIGNCKNLNWLNIRKCEKLRELNGLGGLTCLSEIFIVNCPSVERLPDLSDLKYVGYVWIDGCHELREINGLEGLTSLETLYLKECPSLELERLPDLSNLKVLEAIIIEGSNKLREINGLEGLTSLKELCLKECPSLKRLSDLSNLKDLIHIMIEGCHKLHEINGLEGLTSLKTVHLKECSSLKRPNLSNLKDLIHIMIEGCHELREINGLEGLTSLETLHLKKCTSLERLPDLSNLKVLEAITIEGSNKLREINGLEGLTSLKKVCLKKCSSLKKPDLSNLEDLTDIDIMIEDCRLEDDIMNERWRQEDDEDDERYNQDEDRDEDEDDESHDQDEDSDEDEDDESHDQDEDSDEDEDDESHDQDEDRDEV